MSSVFISVIQGINTFAVPEDNSETLAAQSAFDAILSGVANLTYESIFALTKDDDSVGGQRTLNCFLSGVTYLGSDVPSEADTTTMLAEIKAALLADADISSVSVQEANLIIQPASDVISLPGVERTVFVDEGSNTTEDGTIQNPYHTFTDALNFVATQSPTQSEPWTILGVGRGVTTETITTVEWCDIYAPEWRVIGNIILVDNVDVEINELAILAGTGVLKSTGTGTSRFKAKRIDVAGGSIGVLNVGASSVILAEVDTVYVGAGAIAFGDVTGVVGHMHVRVKDIYLIGAGAVGLARIGSGVIEAYIDHILEADAGVNAATGVNAISGTFNIFCGQNATNIAITVGNGGVVNYHGQQIIGNTSALNAAAGGTIRATYSELSGAVGGAGTVLQSFPT